MMPSNEELAHLRSLVPLHTLPEDALAELLEGAVIETVSKGNLLFEQGDTDHEHVYLLQGNVQLLSGDAVVETVNAGSDTARFPLAHQLPRKLTGRAKSKLRIARLDSRRLSEILARTRTVDYQVDDLAEASEDDWMSMLLQSRVLQQVPASNIQRVMMSVEQEEVRKGQDLIRQGDPGDFYYMLTRGRAVVRRDSGDGNGPTELATLGPGDAFGEEALLSDNPRNSTVTMLQDGHVLRLGKDQFLELIHNPLLDRIDMATAETKVDKGALWLDLRSSEQYDELHLPGAINFPFESLRYQAASLAPDRHYVLYSNTGGRAMAGAFLLTERGFDVSVLDSGVNPEHTGEAQPQEVSVVPEPVSDTVDAATEERIREAERRAEELEEQLKAVKRDQDNVTAERQQHLQQVRSAVDQARRKVLETEQQKREALEDRQKAYAEMERLTGNLEEIESERASLLDRMSEIEGLDKQLQSRLAKAERELIVERERAESANQSLEELSQQLSDALDQREQERQQHALERGRLKESLTELQMEFEEAKLDLEEAQQAVAAVQSKAGEAEEVEELRQRLTSSESANADLREEVETWRRQAEGMQSAETRLVELQEKLDEQTKSAKKTEKALRAEVEQTKAQFESDGQEQSKALEQVRVQASEHQQQAQAATEALEAIKQELDQARTEIAERQAGQDAATAELQHQIDKLQQDKRQLQDELAASNAEVGSALAEAQQRVVDLETQLERQSADAREAIEQKQGELDTALANSKLTADEASALHDANAALDEKVQALTGQLAAATEQAETTRGDAQSQVEAFQQSLADAQQRVTELETQLARQSADAREAIEQKQGELDTALANSKTAADEVSTLRDTNVALDEKVQMLTGQLAAATERAEAARGDAQSQVEALQQSLADVQVLADERQRRFDGLQAEHQALQNRLAADEQDAKAVLDQAQASVEALETQLDESRSRQQAADEELGKVRSELEVLRPQAEQLDTLRAEIEQLRDERARNAENDVTAKDERLAQLRDEIQELAQKLEERDMALNAARAEQAELIEALNAASAERETLQFAISEREDEQARLVDLENQVADAIHTHESELLNHEQQQRDLREQLDAETARRYALQDEVERLQKELADDGGSDGVVGLRAERDALTAKLAERDNEVKQLRTVMEEYVDQIRGAQGGGDHDEVSALRTELEMVREQAIRDVAHMREQLAAVETQKRRLQQADGREAISLESMRQRIEELETTLGERQRDLTQAEESHQTLEDSLEDKNREFEQLQSELDEMLGRLREAESARDQLQEALGHLQENADEAKVTDLRDERLALSSRPLGMDSVVPPHRRGLAALIGAALVLGALEALSFLTGNGELFTALLKISGQ